MGQQYTVEVNNIFDCLEHEATEQVYEKDRVDIFWTNVQKVYKRQHTVYCQIL